jgi:glutamine synthetase
MSKGVDLTGISWVRLSFVDVFGASHSMQVPARRFAAAATRGEPFDGSSLEGRARLVERDMRLLPDPAAFVRLGGGLARAVCTVLSDDGTPWSGDPRTALAQAVARVGALGRDYTAAPEIEFYLLDEDGAPVDGGGYFDETEAIGAVVVRQAADRLEGFGIAVDSVHHEAGPGQYEIDLEALPPVRLADAIVLAKQVVRDTAASAGLRATFMPMPLPGEAGSGLHLHQRAGSRLTGGDGSLTDDGRAFMAGQLAHARGLCALTAPTVNSYKRLHSGPEAPSAIVWAHVNRGALIRLSPNMTAGATIEYRGIDPSANPYLLLAGLLVAAAHGIGESTDLPPAFEEEIGSYDPASIDSTRSELLPRDLDEALDALLADDVLVDAFDAQMLSRLVDGRRAEASDYGAQVTEWEIERYLDEA